MSNPSQREILHQNPCTQTNTILEIHRRIGSIETTINGVNGNDGMKTDLAIVKLSAKSMEKKLDDLSSSFSTKSEIDDTLEVQRRVDIEVKKRLEEERQKLLQDKERKAKRALSIKDYVIAVFVVFNIILGIYTFFYSDSSEKETEQTDQK